MNPNIIQLLPEHIRDLLFGLKPDVVEQLEEIRLRVSRPVEVISNGTPYYVYEENRFYIFNKDDALYVLSKLSKYSLYAFEEELRRGFITIAGGHRVGLAGKAVIDQGVVRTLRNISSFNIRIAREKKGIAKVLLHHIYDGEWGNTLLIGAPQTGKTTMLRDLARFISKGDKELNIPPLKVGIVDERSEIAGSIDGIPQLDLGMRVDVLDGCPKAEGMMMLIRSMSPDVIIVDEIGRSEDVHALQEALHAGVKVMTTAHGSSLEEIRKRPQLKQLFAINAFDYFIELSRARGPGTIQCIQTGRKKAEQRW